MALKKWLMKQYWRIGTVRALASLSLAVLVLGKLYYGYVPILKDRGLLGALLLGLVLFSLFLAIGWAYDKKAKLWSQKIQAITERNPYQYVPNYRSLTIDFPYYLALFSTLKHLFEKTNLDTEIIDETIDYLKRYFHLKPEKQDFQNAKEFSTKFMSNHPFVENRDSFESEIPLSAKMKQVWETNMLRLNWIQNLTGLVQDVLVFGALYGAIIFITFPQAQRLLFSFVGITLPLLLLLIGAGWYYDRKLKIWSVDIAVKIERNPFSYVIEPRLMAFSVPFFHATMVTLYDILEAQNLDTTSIDAVAEYMNEYMKLSSSRNQDLIKAQSLRKSLGQVFGNRKVKESMN